MRRRKSGTVLIKSNKPQLASGEKNLKNLALMDRRAACRRLAMVPKLSEVKRTTRKATTGLSIMLAAHGPTACAACPEKN